MKQTPDSEDLIERYLLGELSIEERTALENECLTDKAKYDQVCRIEDDLLYRYARGSLAPADRERVERQYLTNPWRRRHLEFAKALAQVIDGELATKSAAKRITGVSWMSQLVALPSGMRGVLRLIPAIAALVVVSGGMWLAIETSRLRVRLREAKHEVEAQQQRAQAQLRQITELETQYRRLTEEHESLLAQLLTAQNTESSRFAPILLTISVEEFRNSGAKGTQTLLIPRGAAGAKLRLNLPENVFPSYRVTLTTVDGSEAFRKNGLKPRADKAGDFVIVNLPASRLTNGDNVLSLSGISPKGEAEPLGKTLIKVRRR
jgi:anti-sigma factor RsiW